MKTRGTGFATYPRKRTMNLTISVTVKINESTNNIERTLDETGSYYSDPKNVEGLLYHLKNSNLYDVKFDGLDVEPDQERIPGVFTLRKRTVGWSLYDSNRELLLTGDKDHILRNLAYQFDAEMEIMRQLVSFPMKTEKTYDFRHMLNRKEQNDDSDVRTA